MNPDKKRRRIRWMCWLFVLAGLVVILPMKRTFGERDLFFPQPPVLSAWDPGVEPLLVA